MGTDRIERFSAAADAMRCPLCKGALTHQGTSLRCPKGHAFVVSSRGYANLLPHQKPLKGYDRAFFRERRALMEQGLYDHVAAMLVDALKQYLPAREERPLVVDAGCGEGTYARAVRDALGCRMLAFDLSKDAAYVAAAGNSDVCWAVADVADIPVRDGAASAVVDAFTPANYSEFVRILKPGGILAKIVPGSEHMRELRHAARGLIRSESYSNERVASYFAEHFEEVGRLRATQTVELDPAQARSLKAMTPVLFGVDARERDAVPVDRITVDAELLVGRRPE